MDFFPSKRPILLHAFATCSEIPPNISAMVPGYPRLVKGREGWKDVVFSLKKFYRVTPKQEIITNILAKKVLKS